MQSLSLQTSNAAAGDAPDLAQEVARLEALLVERRAELTALQEDLRVFKARYARTVGRFLSELEEIERAVKEAEARRLGLEREDEEDAARAAFDEPSPAKPVVAASLRKLFWSVARMFHPDYATDEAQARQRHKIMAEASRAYREGDVESLHSLLGDEQLQFYCASASNGDDDEDLAARLLNLKEDLRTIEFGLKRTRQESLYRLKQQVDAEAAAGRDALADQSVRLQRHIVKARCRLEHLS